MQGDDDNFRSNSLAALRTRRACSRAAATDFESDEEDGVATVDAAADATELAIVAASLAGVNSCLTFDLLGDGGFTRVVVIAGAAAVVVVVLVWLVAAAASEAVAALSD